MQSYRNSGVMKNKNVFGGRKTRKLSRTNTSTHAQLPFNTGNLIKTFPRANDFQTPYGLSKEKVSTFLLMYRTHCQRLIDAFVCANYEDVENYLNHFWSGIPNHLQDVFDNEFMVNVIECADSVMYKVSSSKLIRVLILALLLWKWVSTVYNSEAFVTDYWRRVHSKGFARVTGIFRQWNQEHNGKHDLLDSSLDENGATGDHAKANWNFWRLYRRF